MTSGADTRGLDRAGTDTNGPVTNGRVTSGRATSGRAGAGPAPAAARLWRPWLATACAAGALLLVSACGGGSDGDAPPPTAAPTAAPTPLPSSLAPALPQGWQQPGAALAFSAGVPDPARQLRYQWQFGDGNSSTAAAPAHSYALPGAYRVQLTVTNEAGDTRSAQATLVVADQALAQGLQCSGSGPQQAGWCWQRPLPRGGAIADLALNASGRGWAVGAAGMLLATQDGGATWAPQPAPTEQDLLQVVAVNDQVAWVAAASGELLVTHDGGLQWQVAGLGSNEPPQALGVTDDGAVWVLARSGSRYSSSDGGGRWNRMPAPPPAVFGATLTAADGSVWVVPGYGYAADGASYGMHFARSSDGGATWLQGAMPPLVPGLSRNAWAAQAASHRVALVRTTDAGFDTAIDALISRANLWRTADGGATWQAATLAPNDDGSTVSYQLFGAQQLLALVPGTNVYLSGNGGDSWALLPLPTEAGATARPQQARQLGASRYLLTSTSGRVWYSSNAGLAWLEVRATQAAPGPSLGSVHFFDRREGLAVAGDGSGLRTSDGGLTWLDAGTAPASLPSGLRLARFLPGTGLGWAADDSGRLHISTDRGRSWSAASALPTGAQMLSLTDLHFADAQRGWAVLGQGSSSQANIFRSGDGGRSWQAVAPADTGLYGGLSAVRFAADGQHGVALTLAGLALTSSDGGQRWQARSTGTSHALRRLVFLADGHTVLAVGDGGVVMRSSDRGQHWQRMATPTDQALHDVAFSSPLQGWAAGEQGTLLKTSDGGLTWAAVASGTRATLLGLHFVDDHTGWVVGGQGVILVTINGGG